MQMISAPVVEPGRHSAAAAELNETQRNAAVEIASLKRAGVAAERWLAMRIGPLARWTC